ncbi:transcriptional regulator [Acinetobacter corruptisaponis]
MVKNNIENLREKAGVTVYELAKRCGFISVGRVLGKKISDAEDGKNITIESALIIYNELKKAGVCENFEEVFWLDDKNNNQ